MDPRIETSLTRALETRNFVDLLERAGPAMGLPGHKPKLEVVREIGLAIAHDRVRERGRELARLLGASEREDARVIAAAAFAAFAVSAPGGPAAPGASKKRGAPAVPGSESLAALEELADDPRSAVRHGVVDAVRSLLAADLPTTLTALQSWTDGFLQAHVALEALTDRKILATVPTSADILALLDPAFELADNASRAADRWQGVRLLREGFPAQITAFVVRFNELFQWVLARAAATRPETREVLSQTTDALLRATVRKSDIDTLRDALAKSAKPPRDPSRIVKGTRKRSGR